MRKRPPRSNTPQATRLTPFPLREAQSWEIHCHLSSSSCIWSPSSSCAGCILEDAATCTPAFNIVSLHTILFGAMGTIYKCHTELPLSKLGLDRCRVRKLTVDLNTHAIQYATKIINTSKRLKTSRKEHMALFRTLPTPLITFFLV